MNRTILRKGILGSFAVASAFAAGYATGGSGFATSINKGLVNAFAAVGQNLFGEAAFDTSFVPPNPTFPAGSVQLFLAEDVKLGTGLNVFVPPNPITPVDPCRAAVQIRVQPTSPPIMPFQIVVDPDVAPGGFDTQIAFESLAAYRPSLERCQAPPVDP